MWLTVAAPELSLSAVDKGGFAVDSYDYPWLYLNLAVKAQLKFLEKILCMNINYVINLLT